MSDEPAFEEWIIGLRAIKPSPDLPDRVMSALEESVPCRRGGGLAVRLNNCLPARWTACLSALLVGSLPFVYAAYAVKLLVF